MKHALNDLLGLHDFAAFQKAGSNRSNSLTTVQDVSISRDGDIVTVEIQASGFFIWDGKAFDGPISCCWRKTTFS